jgi:hypothetical protein
MDQTFGVDNSSQVEAYEVIYIHRHRIFFPEHPLQGDASPIRGRGVILMKIALIIPSLLMEGVNIKPDKLKLKGSISKRFISLEL